MGSDRRGLRRFRRNVIDLSEQAGFDLCLQSSPEPVLVRKSGEVLAASARVMRDLRGVLADAESADLEADRVAYWAVRGAAPPGANRQLTGAGLRYDVILMPPGRFGRELPKTAGHYHARHARGFGYPEIYEVLHGSAIFVLQFVDDPNVDDPFVRDVWVTRCGAGDRFVIPPDCGHVTVNAGAEPLVYSTTVSVTAENRYDPYVRHQGAACYVLADGGEIEPNPRYANPSEAGFVDVAAEGLRWHGDAPVLNTFLSFPERFEFLVDPSQR